MSDHRPDHLDLCASYALGALEGPSLKEFERHLESGCPDCSTELESYASIVHLLAIALPTAASAPELKERVIFAARVAQVAKARLQEPEEREKVVRPPRPRRIFIRKWWRQVLAVTAVIAALGAAYLVVIEPLSTEIDDQAQYIMTQNRRIDQLKTALERDEDVLQVLQSLHVDVVPLKGSGLTRKASGRVIWNRISGSALLQVFNLPVPPADSDYQLWLKLKKGSVNFGAFAPEEGAGWGNLFAMQPADIDTSSGVDGFILTLEARGEAPRPSGRVCLTGKLREQQRFSGRSN